MDPFRVSAGYATLWEFLVQPSQQAEFERHYAPDGSWAALFRKAPGYIGTELLHERGNRLRYVTIDRWTGIEAYRAFRRQYADDYALLDRRCEGLTTHEAPLGEYDQAARA